jgi:hypothetical protein
MRPFKITKIISDLNYEIMSQHVRKWIVHVNRIKMVFSQNVWGQKPKPRATKKLENLATKRPMMVEPENLGDEVLPTGGCRR